MKNNFLRSLILIALLSIHSNIFAFFHDFEVQNSEDVTIYYNITSKTDLTVEVTYEGSLPDDFDEYSGSVVIPETVTYKGNTYTVTSIGLGAFQSCTGLTSVTIPNSVTSIGYGAFQNCTGLTSVTIPNSVTSIKDQAFEESGWYNNQPDGILYLDKCCLGYKSKKPTGTLPLKDDTRLIAYGAFFDCTELTSVTIGNSVTSIGDGAFQCCTGLTSVTIGNSVTSIGKQAFEVCTELTNIISLNTTPPTCGINVFYCDLNHNIHIPLTVPQESVLAYKSADTWKHFLNIISKDLSGVEDMLVDDSETSAEYYDLNGVRVQNPEKGVYIKRVNNTTHKVIL